MELVRYIVLNPLLAIVKASREEAIWNDRKRADLCGDEDLSRSAEQAGRTRSGLNVRTQASQEAALPDSSAHQDPIFAVGLAMPSLIGTSLF